MTAARVARTTAWRGSPATSAEPGELLHPAVADQQHHHGRHLAAAERHHGGVLDEAAPPLGGALGAASNSSTAAAAATAHSRSTYPSTAGPLACPAALTRPASSRTSTLASRPKVLTWTWSMTTRGPGTPPVSSGREGAVSVVVTCPPEYDVR